jgi:aminopeptidase N
MTTETAQPKPTFLKDYTPPDFEVRSINLTFHLDEEFTQVHSELQLSKKKPGSNVPLKLQGRELELVSLYLNNETLNSSDYATNAEELTLNNVPDNFTLKITTKINPPLNTSLEGLYKVKNLFCTQCEAEGFRKITYYFDRPDVMTKFTTTIIADKNKYPILLSNGNLISSQNLEEGKHSAAWQDPFKKPCYLFALVAGNLACLEDEFITKSNRKIKIKLFVDHGDEDKTSHALISIKKAMKWDEDTFGREYDLDIFMVVATHDFNMGAMENKGLNIFNSKYILANPTTATDEDYIAIERVIGHEYFHNWTGNRITCREWFQLSLKEGLTVFRDAQFSADMTSPAVVRINDVNTLRSVQFPQDAGPMAHPVQPKSYIEINNFYTVTIYEKGAEIIHMLYTLLGKENFRKGMDLYFDRHDGQAVRIEEFVQAHADANNKDLSQFMLWYHEAGTPELNISTQYHSDKKQYTLTIQQQHKSNKAFYMPFKMGLLDSTGKEIVSDKLELKNLKEVFTFNNISEKPVISLLRDFSAPVKLNYNYTDKELEFLLSFDTDPVSQWNAGQELAVRLVKENIKSLPHITINHLNFAYENILNNKSLDPALCSLLLLLPNEHYLIEQIDCTKLHHLDKLFSARKTIRDQLAEKLKSHFLTCYQQLFNKHKNISIGERALKNRCLAYLGLLEQSDTQIQDIISHQFYQADNMTDQIAALSVISHLEETHSEKQKAFDYFYVKFENQPLVIDKWFGLQARSENSNVLETVKSLLQHPAFSMKNPNKVRSLIGAFTQNLPAFHESTGSGYAFLTDKIIELNSINPMIAARLCEPFTRWQKYDENRQTLIKNCLLKIKNTPNLSVDIYEVVTKSLEQ